MIDALKAFFDRHLTPETGDNDGTAGEQACRLAAAALLVEVSKADHVISAQEMRTMTEAVRRAFELSEEEAEQTMIQAREASSRATSLYEFTSAVNEHFDAGEKVHLVELLWQVAYADGHVDRYEDYVVRKVADLIHVPHRDFIRTKHRAAAARYEQ